MQLSLINIALTRIYGGAASFSPSSLFAASEEGIWLDPSDLSTMFQDSAGTTPVTADGQPVGLILDKSGRGNHASQATAAARPLYKTDGTYHWLQFDGVDDSLSTASIDFTGTNKMSAFSGRYKASNASAGLLYELSTNVSSNNGSMYFSSPENGIGEERSSSKGTTVASQITLNVPVAKYVVSEIRDIAAPLISVKRNGGVAVTNNTNQGTGNFGNHPLYIGSRAGSSLYFNGKIYSLIVRGALSTAQEITDTETWVNNKTGAF